MSDNGARTVRGKGQAPQRSCDPEYVLVRGSTTPAPLGTDLDAFHTDLDSVLHAAPSLVQVGFGPPKYCNLSFINL